MIDSFSLFSVNPTWFVNINTSQSRPNIVQRCSARWSRRSAPIDDEQSKKQVSNYLWDNLSRVITLLIYILINLGLTMYVIIYRTIVLKSNVFVVFARIAGMLLNFNCLFVIILMLKQTILLIRTIGLHKLLPIDDHIDFHKFVGRFIAVLSVFHSIAHAINFGLEKGKCIFILRKSTD